MIWALITRIPDILAAYGLIMLGIHLVRVTLYINTKLRKN